VLADLDLIDRRQHVAKVRRAVAPRVVELATEFGMEGEQFHIVPGPPERVVPGVASKLKAETVVLGTIGRKGIRARVIGNTAEAVLGRLQTDIIAVKPS
jgi:universal stress protein E